MGYPECPDDVCRALLSGLRAASLAFQTSLRNLGQEAGPGALTTRQLSETSVAAGRLMGYLEALEATNRAPQRTVALEIIAVMDEVQAFLRQVS